MQGNKQAESIQLLKSSRLPWEIPHSVKFHLKCYKGNSISKQQVSAASVSNSAEIEIGAQFKRGFERRKATVMYKIL